MNIKILAIIVTLAIGSSCGTAHPEDMDPVTATVIWTVGSAAGALIGYAGVESYNQLNENNNNNNNNGEFVLNPDNSTWDN